MRGGVRAGHVVPGTRTLHWTNIFYFQIFSAGGELKYFLCCLAIYLTSICEYIKLLHLTWWMSWLKSSGLGNWNIKYLQPGVISLVRNMLGPDTKGQTVRPLCNPPTLLTDQQTISVLTWGQTKPQARYLFSKLFLWNKYFRILYWSSILVLIKFPAPPNSDRRFSCLIDLWESRLSCGWSSSSHVTQTLASDWSSQPLVRLIYW